MVKDKVKSHKKKSSFFIDLLLVSVLFGAVGVIVWYVKRQEYTPSLPALPAPPTKDQEYGYIIAGLIITIILLVSIWRIWIVFKQATLNTKIRMIAWTGLLFGLILILFSLYNADSDSLAAGISIISISLITVLISIMFSKLGGWIGYGSKKPNETGTPDGLNDKQREQPDLAEPPPKLRLGFMENTGIKD